MLKKAQRNGRALLTVGAVLLIGVLLSTLSGLLNSTPAGAANIAASGVSAAAVTTPSASPSATSTPTPTPTTVTLNVPVIQQLMVLDCETAALQQGLAYYGISVSQAELYALENADTRLPLMSANHTILQWANPYTNFVGYVNGSDWTPTGYGVYWPVILKLAQTHGLPNATGGEGYSPSAIYAALAAGHPVQVWIETNFMRVPVGTYTAWDGTQVRYSFAEHSLTLSGVSPTQVRVNDVLNGTQYWVSKSLFEANFADFNNMAVIF